MNEAHLKALKSGSHFYNEITSSSIIKSKESSKFICTEWCMMKSGN